jgi:hypothetical protein
MYTVHGLVRLGPQPHGGRHGWRNVQPYQKFVWMRSRVRVLARLGVRIGSSSRGARHSFCSGTVYRAALIRYPNKGSPNNRPLAPIHPSPFSEQKKSLSKLS